MEISSNNATSRKQGRPRLHTCARPARPGPASATAACMHCRHRAGPQPTSTSCENTSATSQHRAGSEFNKQAHATNDKESSQPARREANNRGEEAPLESRELWRCCSSETFRALCSGLRSPISDPDLRSPISDRPERISGVRGEPLLDPDKMSNNNRAYLVAMLVAPLSRIACGLELQYSPLRLIGRLPNAYVCRQHTGLFSSLKMSFVVPS